MRKVSGIDAKNNKKAKAGENSWKIIRAWTKKYMSYGDEKKRYFPADKKLIDWLWEHPDIREELWKTMEENQE